MSRLDIPLFFFFFFFSFLSIFYFPFFFASFLGFSLGARVAGPRLYSTCVGALDVLGFPVPFGLRCFAFVMLKLDGSV
jgi:hypothetical protein